MMPMMSVPDDRWADPTIGCTFATGQCAVEAVWDMPNGVTLAADTETPGIHDPFTHKCLTLAWHDPSAFGGVVSVLLDPARNREHQKLAREAFTAASSIVFHNAPFDVPGLVHAGLMQLADVDKVFDTLVAARMAWPDTLVRKNLEAVAKRLLGLDDLVSMSTAFKAAGHRTIADGYRDMDIDSPIYRQGAMADTAVTLRILGPLGQAVVDQLTDHPFETYGCTSAAAAHELHMRQQRVNRVMLRRSARGIAVDREYLDRYRDEVDGAVLRAEAELRTFGIEPGANAGKDLIAQLAASGDLPGAWPRTPGGALRATKADLDGLDHPAAAAHRQVAYSTKVIGYLEKVSAMSSITGRLHPQCAVLGASATGRMSYGSPELQQFPAEARPILVSDGEGMTSIDWSQIEPVTMANMAGDRAFLEPFERGDDLYEPIQRAAGIDRKTAKVVLLATMYGQGETKLAQTIKHSPESTAQIKRQMLSAMPESSRFMAKVAGIAERHGKIPTLTGRILDVPVFNGQVSSYKATNYICQGSAYDVMTHAILGCEDAGLGDAIYLSMHDELVVSESAAVEVERIMLTPPPEFERWGKHTTPVLRTDRENLGHSWLKPE